MNRTAGFLLRVVAVAALAGAPLIAHASVVYSNENTQAPNGNCLFNDSCAFSTLGDPTDPTVKVQPIWAGQAFTLTRSTVLTGASWIEEDARTSPGTTSILYEFFDAAGGLPKAAGFGMYNGSTTPVAADDLGPDPGFSFGSGFETYRLWFSLPSLVLGPGDYFFAVHSIFDPDNGSSSWPFLAQGRVNSGAGESFDGGFDFLPGYEGMGGVSLALYDASVAGAPEPGVWALMLMGFGGLGAALRARRRPAAA